MFAWLAVIAFVVALFVRLIIGGHGGIVTDAMLFGYLFIALHLATGAALPWPRRRAAPPAQS